MRLTPDFPKEVRSASGCPYRFEGRYQVGLDFEKWMPSAVISYLQQVQEKHPLVVITPLTDNDGKEMVFFRKHRLTPNDCFLAVSVHSNDRSEQEAVATQLRLRFGNDFSSFGPQAVRDTDGDHAFTPEVDL